MVGHGLIEGFFGKDVGLAGYTAGGRSRIITGHLDGCPRTMAPRGGEEGDLVSRPDKCFHEDVDNPFNPAVTIGRCFFEDCGDYAYTHMSHP